MTDKTDSKERDLMELVDAYAEARHIGGCHTYNAKAAEARNAVIASLAQSGYDASDMASASAQGFRDGVASLAASAGSEPVPFGHWFTDDPKAFATPGSGFLVGKEPPKNAINVIPLYTHPSPPEGMVGGWLSITGTLCSMGNIGEEDLAAISPETPRITLQAADGSVVHIVGLSREHVGGMAPQFYNQAQLILAPRPTTSAGSGKGE